eukprot:Ihof_evm5s270 gene=Ihof_evmTU5s270
MQGARTIPSKLHGPNVTRVMKEAAMVLKEATTPTWVDGLTFKPKISEHSLDRLRLKADLMGIEFPLPRKEAPYVPPLCMKEKKAKEEKLLAKQALIKKMLPHMDDLIKDHHA